MSFPVLPGSRLLLNCLKISPLIAVILILGHRGFMASRSTVAKDSPNSIPQTRSSNWGNGQPKIQANNDVKIDVRSGVRSGVRSSVIPVKQYSDPVTNHGMTASPSLPLSTSAQWQAQNPVTVPVRSTPFLGNQRLNSASQILLNGKSYSLPWVQWTSDRGTRLGLPDGVLQKLLGIDFLSNTNVLQQPIAWLGSEATLAVQFIGADRYLDVTDWLIAMGWQVQVQGNQLLLTPVSATVKSLQQVSAEPPEVADRIVIELDRPTSYQIDAQSQEWVLRLDAQLPANSPPFVPKPSQKLASLSLKPEGNQTVLKLGIPLSTRPSVTQMNNRLIIDVGRVNPRNHDILWQSGIRWRQQMLTIGNVPITLNTLEVEPQTPGLKLRPLLPSREIAGISTLMQTAQQGGSIAAINGGFFNRNNQLPLGLVQVDGQVRSGPILNRGVVAWNSNGGMEFDRYTLQETATIGTKNFALTHLNSAYVQAGVARYTPAWGASYQTLSDGEVVLAVQGDRVTQVTPVPTVGTSVGIPSNGYLLTFRSNRTGSEGIAIGTPVILQSGASNPRIAGAVYAIGAGPLLIKDQRVVLDAALEKFSPAFIKERAARSAIGRLRNGNLLILSAQPSFGRGGITLEETAQLMQQMGAVDALNLDGGSSTTLHLGGLGGQIVDRPLRSSARVHNAIGIFRE